jgi:hypothetical protein
MEQRANCECLNSKWDLLEDLHLELSRIFENFKVYPFIYYYEKCKGCQYFYCDKLEERFQSLQNRSESVKHLFGHLDHYEFREHIEKAGDFVVKARDPFLLSKVSLYIQFD